MRTAALDIATCVLNVHVVGKYFSQSDHDDKFGSLRPTESPHEQVVQDGSSVSRETNPQPLRAYVSELPG